MPAAMNAIQAVLWSQPKTVPIGALERVLNDHRDQQAGPKNCLDDHGGAKDDEDRPLHSALLGTGGCFEMGAETGLL